MYLVGAVVSMIVGLALLASPLSSSELTMNEVKNIFDQLIAESNIVLK